MKDNTLIANNKSKTKITFEYDHGLPFKEKIMPEMSYGTWKENKDKTLVKIFFNNEDLSYFNNPNHIVGLGAYNINEEIWIDLENVYLVIEKNKVLLEKFKEKNIIIAFLNDNNLINAIELQ